MSEADAARVKRCLNTEKEVRSKVDDVRTKIVTDREKLEATETRLKGLKSQLAEVKARVKDSKDERDALKLQLETLRAKMIDDQKILSFEDKMSAVRTKQLEEEVRAYEELLGLCVKKLADRRLQVLFKHIAPSVKVQRDGDGDAKVEEMEPACEIFIKITDDDLFAVERTNPDLGDLTEALNLLNKTQDLRSFLILVRDLFCKFFAKG